MSNTEIGTRIRRYIADHTTGDFGELALAAHHYQYARNDAYRRFVDRQEGPAPQRWEEIPAVPAFAFKEADLASAPAADVFLSSGTTQGPTRRARHHVPDLTLYHHAALTGFQRAVLPSGQRRPFLVAAPERRSHPMSSLGAMVTWLREAHDSGTEPSFLVEGAVNCERFASVLDALDPNQPILVLAVTAALLQLADYADPRGRSWTLPSGSLVVDTGGCKGYAENLERAAILARYRTLLGVESSAVINEYGMTEMCSQLYARDAKAHRPPPWVRSRVFDPATGTEAAPGQVGILRHLDLANLGSVVCVQTEDIGRRTETGVEVLGRVAGAEPRGCSLLLAS